MGDNVRKRALFVLCIAVGAVGWWLFISHVAHFEIEEYFYGIYEKNPLYSGTNIVSRWADFSYFTYHTLVFFSTWCVLYGAGSLAGAGRLVAFLRKSTVLSFIFCNYCLTVVMYTAFELAARPITFGLYAKTPLAVHNLGTNILAHYVMFACCAAMFVRVPAERGNVRLALPVIVGYLAVYCAAVKLAGEFAYVIRWFPYPIFDLESFGSLLGVKGAAAAVLLAATYLLLAAAYIAAFLCFVRIKSKAKRGAPARNNENAQDSGQDPDGQGENVHDINAQNPDGQEAENGVKE